MNTFSYVGISRQERYGCLEFTLVDESLKPLSQSGAAALNWSEKIAIEGIDFAAESVNFDSLSANPRKIKALQIRNGQWSSATPQKLQKFMEDCPIKFQSFILGGDDLGGTSDFWRMSEEQIREFASSLPKETKELCISEGFVFKYIVESIDEVENYMIDESEIEESKDKLINLLCSLPNTIESIKFTACFFNYFSPDQLSQIFAKLPESIKVLQLDSAFTSRIVSFTGDDVAPEFCIDHWTAIFEALSDKKVEKLSLRHNFLKDVVIVYPHFFELLPPSVVEVNLDKNKLTTFEGNQAVDIKHHKIVVDAFGNFPENITTVSMVDGMFKKMNGSYFIQFLSKIFRSDRNIALNGTVFFSRAIVRNTNAQWMEGVDCSTESFKINSLCLDMGSIDPAQWEFSLQDFFSRLPRHVSHLKLDNLSSWSKVNDLRIALQFLPEIGTLDLTNFQSHDESLDMLDAVPASVQTLILNAIPVLDSQNNRLFLPQRTSLESVCRRIRNTVQSLHVVGVNLGNRYSDFRINTGAGGAVSELTSANLDNNSLFNSQDWQSLYKSGAVIPENLRHFFSQNIHYFSLRKNYLFVGKSLEERDNLLTNLASVRKKINLDFNGESDFSRAIAPLCSSTRTNKLNARVATTIAEYLSSHFSGDSVYSIISRNCRDFRSTSGPQQTSSSNAAKRPSEATQENKQSKAAKVQESSAENP